MGFHVYTILKDKKLKQREISSLLGIAQPDVSHLMNGHLSRLTTDKVLDFLKRLDRKIIVRNQPAQTGRAVSGSGVYTVTRMIVPKGVTVEGKQILGSKQILGRVEDRLDCP